MAKKRMPSTQSNPVQYQRDDYSPSFLLMNAQISKTVGKKHPMDFYLGGENLTNYFQKDVIIAADDPFSSYFDASLVWGPVTGRMIYAGWRYRITYWYTYVKALSLHLVTSPAVGGFAIAKPLLM